MKTIIHPYLIARFMAVQAAFMQPGFRFPSTQKKFIEDSDEDESGSSGKSGGSGRNSQPVATAPRGNNWNSVLKKSEGDDDEEGGGGTIKGNRGKNAVHAAAAMKKLTRNR